MRNRKKSSGVGFSECSLSVKASRVSRYGLDDYVINSLRISCRGDSYCFVNMLAWWMYHRADYLAKCKSLPLNDFLKKEIIKDFKKIAKKVTCFIQKHYGKLTYREKQVFSQVIDTIIMDALMQKHGYPSILKILNIIENIVDQHSSDFIINYDEFCKKLGANPQQTILPLSVIITLQLFPGIHISTMKKVKYRLLPRMIGFDSLFIRRKYIKQYLPIINQILHKINK